VVLKSPPVYSNDIFNKNLLIVVGFAFKEGCMEALVLGIRIFGVVE
jgi:hypothetical protein